MYLTDRNPQKKNKNRGALPQLDKEYVQNRHYIVKVIIVKDVFP